MTKTATIKISAGGSAASYCVELFATINGDNRRMMARRVTGDAERDALVEKITTILRNQSFTIN